MTTDVKTSIRNTLGKICTFLFGAGFVVLKVHKLPIPVISFFSGLIAYGLYFTAYALWFIRTFFDPGQESLSQMWYSLLPFNNQFQLSALLGILGCVLSALSFFVNPVFILPAAWIFLCCNGVWTVGEYHKLNNPPLDDPQYSESYQKVYLSYSKAITLITLISTLTTTIAILCPALSIPITVLGSMFCLAIGIIACHYWIEATFGEHPTLAEVKESYDQMENLLGKNPSPSESLLEEAALDARLWGKSSPLLIQPTIESSENELNVVYSPSLH